MALKTIVLLFSLVNCLNHPYDDADIPEPIYTDDIWVDPHDDERHDRNALLKDNHELLEVLTDQM